MAITSISRLQHRRGIKTDLPVDLYEGELGWCLDTRELFIGNGQGFSGNSQILTQWSQNTNLIQYIYTGTSGIDATTGLPSVPVSRPIGAKLDDFLNVKDYGAVGDGETDDTDAIQRAITDRWASRSDIVNRQLMSMVNIMFPAGRYRITRAIRLYPMTALVGAGKDRCVIVMDASTAPASVDNECVVRTADNQGNTAANIGLNNAVMPTNILVQGIAFDNSANPGKDGILLQRASNVRLADVAVYSDWASGNAHASGSTGISIETLSSLYLCDNITIINATISNFVLGIASSDPTRYVTADQCNITNCWRAVALGTGTIVSGGPSYVKIINNTITNIDNNGVIVNSSNPNITSANNTFSAVGIVDNRKSIHFSSTSVHCSTINDMFSDTDQVHIGNSLTNISISAQQTSIVSNTPLAVELPILDDTVTSPLGIQYDTAVYNNVFIQYTIFRGNRRRAGTFMLVSDGSTVSYSDNGLDHNGSPGVTLSASVSSGIINVAYDATNLGADGTFKYIETKWLS